MPLGEFALLVLGAFTFRGTLISLRGGQITFVLLFILVLFLTLMRNGRPFWAGFALAFVILKPNPFVLLLPLVGLWFFQRRQWRAIVGVAVAGAILFIGSWALLPGWLPGWLDVRGKTIITFMMPTVWGIAYDLSGEWWAAVGLLLAAAVTAVIGWITLTDLID
ncbi:MAG: DUF2029 domain-containing protein [Chloroflexi bacterium]|nr:DUF2029 domain-containing protein [Chloroflexota bacterium]